MNFKKKRKEVMSPFSRLIARIFLQKVSAWHTFKVKVSGGISQEGGGGISQGVYAIRWLGDVWLKLVYILEIMGF